MPTNLRIGKAVTIKKISQEKYSLLVDCDQTGNDQIQINAYGKLNGFGVKYEINASDKVVCFTKPNPDPNPVTVTTGCTFTIQAGNLEYYGLETKFEVLDATLLKLSHFTNSFAVFESLKKGKTSVEVSYQEKGNPGHKISSVIVPVTVDSIDSVLISQKDGRKVHTNAPVRFTAVA